MPAPLLLWPEATLKGLGPGAKDPRLPAYHFTLICHRGLLLFAICFGDLLEN